MGEFPAFVYWAFLSILSGAAILTTKFLFDMKENIGSLNSKMAVILEKITYHEKEIQRHEDRIKELEYGRFK